MATAQTEKQKFKAVHVPIESEGMLNDLILRVSNDKGVPVSAGRAVVVAMEAYLKGKQR